ncbi:MAG TPA: hypothetical protein V6D26_17730 [Stenomitos sp.]
MNQTQDSDEDNLFPVHHHSAHAEFTSEEIEDILHFADTHGIHGVNEARLIAFVRDVREAHRRRTQSKREPTSWVSQTQSTQE